MPWVAPPPDVARKVADVLGDRVWYDLESRWLRVLAVDPAARLTQWYRNPEEIRREYLSNRRAAWLTQHGPGLALDVHPSPSLRAVFIEAARREGFHVRTYPSAPSLVHLSALSDQEWERSPLRSWLRGILGDRPAR